MVKKAPRQIYEEYRKTPGERLAIFSVLSERFPIERVLYPGSYLHLAPSFVFPDVTFVDTDRRAREFFRDTALVQEIVTSRKIYSQAPAVMFCEGDYNAELPLPIGSFDLLVSLYAGFVSQACKRYLRAGAGFSPIRVTAMWRWPPSTPTITLSQSSEETRIGPVS